MTRDVRLYLQDILDAVVKIEEYTRAVTEEQFYQNTLIHDGVLLRLAVIGEAVKHLPQELREQHPQIPWKKISGTRDVVIHQYFSVELRRAWELLPHELPALRAAVQALLTDSY